MTIRNQKYAVSAYEMVEVVSKTTAAQKKKYKTICEKLPILIRQAGLVQALAFVEARGDESQVILLDHIAETLSHVDHEIKNKRDLLEQARGNGGRDDLNQYMLLTQRVLDVMVWYKRFAQSLLKEKPNADDNDDDKEAGDG